MAQGTLRARWEAAYGPIEIDLIAETYQGQRGAVAEDVGIWDSDAVGGRRCPVRWLDFPHATGVPRGVGSSGRGRLSPSW